MESRIIIKELELKCIIGVRDYERIKKQKIFLDIEICSDISKAIKTDNIMDTIDYDLLVKDVITFVEKSKFFLVETLSERIGDFIIKNYNVKNNLKSVLVRVRKQTGLKNVCNVVVEVNMAGDYLPMIPKRV